MVAINHAPVKQAHDRKFVASRDQRDPRALPVHVRGRVAGSVVRAAVEVVLRAPAAADEELVLAEGLVKRPIAVLPNQIDVILTEGVIRQKFFVRT